MNHVLILNLIITNMLEYDYIYDYDQIYDYDFEKGHYDLI